MGIHQYVKFGKSSRGARDFFHEIMYFPRSETIEIRNIAPSMTESHLPTTGKVYLIGAGPGDPGMLTLRGKECLSLANVVIYDYLANPEILSFAHSARQICLGKHGTGRLLPQSEINEMIVEFAQQGLNVVRLKGGDPAIFARTHEELEKVTAAGIPFEIVPGITSALAVTSTVGIPLTHRDMASAVAFITGQGKNGGPPDNIDFESLARFPGTLVFYMATTTVQHWASNLISAGLSPTTPVVAVRNCSLASQRSFQCQLNEIADRVNQNGKLRPPVLFVVGKTASHYGLYNWFEKRPLFGKTVLVTRPNHQAVELGKKLTDLGADVVYQPAIEIRKIQLDDEGRRIVENVGDFQWLVFSSVNGVDHFMSHLFECGDVRKLSTVQIASIGPATRDRLKHYYLDADLVPDSFEAEALADSLGGEVDGKKVLLIRASRGREILNEKLTGFGAEVAQLVCYESLDCDRPDPAVTDLLRSQQIDFVTVTSSAIARSLHRMFGDDLNLAKIVSISPITSSVLAELNHPVDIEATQYTMDGILDSLLEFTADA